MDSGFQGLRFKGLGFEGLEFKGLGFKVLGFCHLRFKGLGFEPKTRNPAIKHQPGRPTIPKRSQRAWRA